MLQPFFDHPKQYHGLDGLICDTNRVSAGKGTLYFWIYVFYLSKFYELLDTVFIVLRKAPLRFLHFYHHSMTFFLCWVCLEYAIPVQWIATSLNAFVHIPMYVIQEHQTPNDVSRRPRYLICPLYALRPVY